MTTVYETEKRNHIPKILQLSGSGEPLGWISYQDFATLQSKDKILWTTGKYAHTLRGGMNAATGQQSVLVMDTIVAVKHDKGKRNKKRDLADYSPTLSNAMLFERDRYLCAYCNTVYPKGKLTRDHVHPISKGGPDIWENVVTACGACNRWKDNKTIADADLELHYLPYKPSFYEHLILENRHLLADQMEFLIKGVSKSSPIYKDYIQKLNS
jgi:hypothetical protein